MASRRLNSDRFFTADYTPQVYTQAGLDWIDDNDMTTVLLRHYPELGPAMRSSPTRSCRGRRRGSHEPGGTLHLPRPAARE